MSDKSYTILIADDDLNSRNLLKSILEKANYTVRAFENGSLALADVETVLPDLILLDVMMPGMTGYEVCEQLSANPKTRDIPVLFISALRDASEKVRAFGVGGLDYINKPFQPREVLARVALHLSLGETRQQLQRTVDELTRAQAQLQIQAERLRLLHEIGQSVVAARSPEAIGFAILGRVRKLVPCQRVLVIARNAENAWALLAAESSDEVSLGFRLEDYEGLLCQAALQKGLIHGVPDLDALPARTPLQQTLWESQIRSYISVPLMVQAELVGILHFEAIHAGAFGTEEISIAQEVAGSLAVAIRQSRLYRVAQQEIAQRERALSLLQATLESTADGIVVLDTERRVLVYNRRLETLWELPEGWLKLSSEEHLALLSSHLQNPVEFVRYLETQLQVPESEVYQLLTLKDGRLFEAYSTPYAVKGKELGRVWSFRDVTIRKRAEEAEIIAEERRRIAQETHDGLVQSLAGLRFRVRQWHKLVDSDPAQMHVELDDLRAVLDESIRDMRRSIFALRPVTLEEQGFFPALHKLVDEYGIHHRLRVKLDIIGPEEHLFPSLELPLFRVIQESMHNVSKHAQASTVWVTLDLGRADAIAVSIRDDGQGFDPATLGSKVRQGHFGLQQMRERVENANGALEIESQPGLGTEVRAIFALRGK